MRFTKDPQAVLDYGHDWSTWLDEGDTISASTWTVPDGITMQSSSHDDTTTTVWLTGGTVGERYELVNHITTTEGRQDDRTLSVVVRQK